MRFSSVVAALACAWSASAVTLVLEAESGSLSSGLTVSTAVTGYTGTGYVDGFDVADDILTLSATGLTAGMYDITIRYMSPNGDKYTTFAVNGAASSEVFFPSGTVWANASAGAYTLTAATNTITLANSWGWYYIDSITVSTYVAPPVYVLDVTNGGKFEAELGVMSGTSVSTASTGFTGTGYVESFDNTGDMLTISVSTTTSKLYDCSLVYGAPYGQKYTAMSLNGLGGSEILLADTTNAASVWATASCGQVLLNVGTNTISFSLDWGWYFIDSVTLTPSTPRAAHQVTTALVNPNASPQAKALMALLVAHYGTDIFSGQQGPQEIPWIEANIGATKAPAMLGIDFIDYSPSRVAYGTTSNQTDSGLAWDARNGILTTMWHWNAPTDLINTADIPWWMAIYATGTTFNLTAALADTSSTRYALLLSDIDAIAVQLKRLQAANIPTLWRPLHEAEGGWFWWGAWGAASYKTLYRLMFTRLTTYHGLNNLIWVWNGVNPDWFPGADVVDVYSYDSYPSVTNDHGPQSAQYNTLLSLSGDKKLIAMAENGAIPDPAILRAYDTDWAYFMTWENEWIESETYSTLEFKKYVYNDAHVIKLTDLPAHWKGSVSSTTSRSSSTSTSSSRPVSTSTSSSRSSSTSRSSSRSTSTMRSTSSSSSRRSSSTSRPMSTTSSTRASSSSTRATSTTTAAGATQTHWGQCGGIGWTGPSACANPYVCTYSNDWYSQCL